MGKRKRKTSRRTPEPGASARGGPGRPSSSSSLISPRMLSPQPLSIQALQETFLLALALLLLTAVAYWPAFFAGFIWDDNIFYDSEHVRDWSGIADIWFNLGSIGSESHYWPMLYTTFWLEHKLWGGFNPAGFHFTNILLHAINGVLLWRLLLRLGIPGAWLITAFFLVHPLRVESVAWVIARKDILAALFYLLAFNCWLSFQHLQSNKHSRQNKNSALRYYAGLLLCYTLGILSKTVTITLPAVLLLWAWWQHGRVSGRVFLYTVPLFLVGAYIGVSGINFFSTRTLIEFEYVWPERLIIASKALWFYGEKTLWPEPLHYIYRLWDVDPARLLNWLPLFGAAALAAALFLARHRIGRGPLTGALFFAITLSPTLGFVDSSYMKFAFVADRYQYLAGVGLLMVLVGGAAYLWRQSGWSKGSEVHEAHEARAGYSRYIAASVAAPLLAACTALTFVRAELFQDKVRLFEEVVVYNPGAYEAYYNLGTFLMERGRAEDAVAAFTTGLDYEPHRIKMYVNLSSALMELERRQEAEAVLRRAVQREPEDFDRMPDPYGARYEAAGVRTNLGMVLMDLERPTEAEAELLYALELEPSMVQAKNNLRALWVEQAAERFSNGDYDGAAVLYQRIVDMDLDNEAIRVNLGLSLGQSAAAHFNAGRFQQALALFRRQTALEPGSAEAHSNLGAALAQLGRLQEAVASFERSLELDPGFTSARNNLQSARQRLDAGN